MSETEKTQVDVFGSQETKFFYDLTPEKILASVESLGFRTTGRCLQLNSMENRVYEVEVDVEDETLPPNSRERFRIVKFYRPGRWSEAQIQEEHQFLFDLQEAEIPTISPFRDSDSRSIFPVPETPIHFSLFPKAGGRSPDELDDAQMLQVGRLLARLHLVGAQRQAHERLRLHPEEFSYPGLDFLIDEQFIPEFLEGQFVDLVEEILEISSPLFENIPFQRIHGDAHLGNLLWGQEGLFWVDFDDMMRGPKVQDLWLVVPGRDEYAKKKLNILLEGYEQFLNFDRQTLRLIEPLRAMRILHFSAWIAKRWEDPAFQKTFVHFGTEKYWQEQLSTLREQKEVILEIL